MSRTEMDCENEALKTALDTYSAEVQIEAELSRKAASVLEQAKNIASAAGTKGDKLPSEAYCTRVAEADPEYLKLREELVQQQPKVRSANNSVEYQRNRVRIAIAVFEATKG